MDHKLVSSWQIEDGREKDIILSSRIRLARNLKNINFLIEALKYLSRIKFGQDTNLIEEKLDQDLFVKLLFKIKDAHLQYNFNNKLDQEKLKIKRAEVIRNILNRE